MSSVAVQRPSATARFPPEEVQDWLDQLQRKIQRGLHPKLEPEPSPEPDSPGRNKRNLADQVVIHEPPQQAQKAVSEDRDVFSAGQPIVDATTLSETYDAKALENDDVFEGSATIEGSTRSSPWCTRLEKTKNRWMATRMRKTSKYTIPRTRCGSTVR